MGDGRAEGSSAIEDSGQAAISLMPDADDTGYGSLLDSSGRSSVLFIATSLLLLALLLDILNLK